MISDHRHHLTPLNNRNMTSFGIRCRVYGVAAAAAIASSNNSNMLMAVAFSNSSPSHHHGHVVAAGRYQDRLGAASTHIQQLPLHNNKDMVSITTRSTSSTHPLTTTSPLFMSTSSDVKFEKVDEDDDQVIAFMDVSGERGIDCYVDSYATVDGVEYTIGCPCDYAVALCYFEGEDEQLVPIELDDPLMDDIFPIAEGIIEDEFGEELVLLRTPQTLTLVGVSLYFLNRFHIF